MKMTPRRPRSDSAKAAVAAAQSVALGPRLPPSHLKMRECDKPFWFDIMTARPRDTWTDADLILAGQLSRTYADIEHLQAAIDEFGMIYDGKPNPCCTLLDTMTKRAMALARQLMINTVSTVGRQPDIAKGAALERAAREDHDDELIPGMDSIQ